MNPSVQDGIIDTYQNSLSWDQTFSVIHKENSVNLSHACATATVSTICAPDQPKKLPYGLIYRFDTSFAGKSSWTALKKMIKERLPGADFIECRPHRALSLNSFRYTLHCSRYKTLEINNQKQYHPESFTQDGVRPETVKRHKTGGLRAIDAMASKTEVRALKNSTTTTSSKVQRKNRNYPSKRRTQSQRAALPSHRCNCQVSIILWNDNFFYLDSRYTNLHHTGHPYIPPIAKKLGSAEITDNQAVILHQLSVMGVQKSKISNLLSSLEHTEGSFSVQTIKNYLNACDILNKKELGLDHRMSSAEAAIEYLHR
jgi:hypothetical protein